MHGADVPWGVGVEVSHGCIRLYPGHRAAVRHGEDRHARDFVYQPVKFGWRGDALYVEVHDDLYGLYAGLWASRRSRPKQGIGRQIDMQKLEKAVEQKTGVPTYIMPGPAPGSAN